METWQESVLLGLLHPRPPHPRRPLLAIRSARLGVALDSATAYMEGRGR